MRRREFYHVGRRCGGSIAVVVCTERPADAGGRSSRQLIARSNSTRTVRRRVAARIGQRRFIEGRNVVIKEFRWAHGNFDRLPSLAAELVRHPVAVIATIGGDVVAIAAKRATATVPVVFTSGGDPIKLGLVDSFNRPGGNVTGVSVVTSGSFTKRLELLREMVPGVAVLGLLVNRTNPSAESLTNEIVAAARDLDQRIMSRTLVRSPSSNLLSLISHSAEHAPFSCTPMSTSLAIANSLSMSWRAMGCLRSTIFASLQ